MRAHDAFLRLPFAERVAQLDSYRTVPRKSSELRGRLYRNLRRRLFANVLRVLAAVVLEGLAPTTIKS